MDPQISEHFRRNFCFKKCQTLNVYIKKQNKIMWNIGTMRQKNGFWLEENRKLLFKRILTIVGLLFSFL